MDLKEHGLAFDETRVGETAALLEAVRRRFSAMPPQAVMGPPSSDCTRIVRQATSEIENALVDFDFKAAMTIVHRIIRRIVDCERGDAGAAERCRSLLPLLEPFAPGLVREIEESARLDVAVLGAK